MRRSSTLFERLGWADHCVSVVQAATFIRAYNQPLRNNRNRNFTSQQFYRGNHGSTSDRRGTTEASVTQSDDGAPLLRSKFVDNQPPETSTTTVRDDGVRERPPTGRPQPEQTTMDDHTDAFTPFEAELSSSSTTARSAPRLQDIWLKRSNAADLRASLTSTYSPLSLEEFETKMLREARTMPSVAATRKALSRIETHYSAPPSALHFTALILAHADPSTSLASLESTLGRMYGTLGADYSPSHAICSAVLRALAVHASSFCSSYNSLREAVLSHMAESNMPITPVCWSYVLAGLIREGQLELAAQRLEQLYDDGLVDLPAWVLSLLIYALLERRDFAGALSVLKMLKERHVELAYRSYGIILDEAAAAVGHEGSLDLCKYIWNYFVAFQYINPSSGTCRSVLLAASRAGDVEVAEKVKGHLLERGAGEGGFGWLEYEMVVDAHYVAGERKRSKKEKEDEVKEGMEKTKTTEMLRGNAAEHDQDQDVQEAGGRKAMSSDLQESTPTIRRVEADPSFAWPPMRPSKNNSMNR